MKDALMTSIVLKPGITLLDIVSTRMLGQVGFMATVFDIFNSNGISVDVVATSEVSISLTLDPRLASPPLPSRPPPPLPPGYHFAVAAHHCKHGCKSCNHAATTCEVCET